MQQERTNQQRFANGGTMHPTSVRFTKKEFIEKVGLSGAAILIFGCMQSCSKDVASSDTQNQNKPPNSSGGDASSNKIDFTIDINTAPYDVLKNIGGYAIYMESKIINI